MRDRAVRSLAATRRRRRPAAGYVASPCRSILIYKPRPAGAPIHYCPVHNSRRAPVTGGRLSLPRFLPFHRRSRTVRRATSGARGPAGRSRGAGGAAPACLFLSCPAAPPSFPLPGTDAGADEATCDCSALRRPPRAATMARRAAMALRRRCPGLCDAVYTSPLLGRHLCAHDSSGDLGARRPKGELGTGEQFAA